MIDKGAAILDYGDEFGGNGVDRTMSNNGPNLKENNLPNKVTPYTKVDHAGSPDQYDKIDVLKSATGSQTKGY